MRRDIGSTAGLLAILAVAMHTVYPTAPEGGGGSSTRVETKAGGSQSKGGGKPSPEEPPEPREGPWLATRAYFAPDNNRQTLPKTEEEYPLKGIFKSQAIKDPKQIGQLHALFGIPPNREIYSVVATVADPLHTRLALLFDEDVDALERAAEAQGWGFAKQWLPWLDPANGAEDDIMKRRRERRLEREQEELPGILVFRNRKVESRRVLLVFLVPESPTGAISGSAFYAALNFANLLPDSNSNGEIGLLAPHFSGSFKSLLRLLEPWMKVDRKGPKLHRTVFGGKISDSASAQVFTAEIEKNTGVRLNFRDGIISLLDQKRTFECEVLPHYGLKREEVAYFVELESGYAGAFLYRENPSKMSMPNPCDQNGKTLVLPIHEYRFPRDIAHLRNAYRESAQSPGRNPGALPNVDFTLKDQTHGEDSIPTFSEAGSAMEQSAALDVIMEGFKQDRIRLVYVTATNELDLIFITQLIRRQSPDTRIVIGGEPDVLFLSAAAQDPLVGTMFLSTYPMFFHGDQWFKPKIQNHPLSSMQGLVNSAQLLISQITGDGLGLLRGYGRLELPGGGLQYPGLWLLTLTRAGFMPVDWFNAHANNENNGEKKNAWFEGVKEVASGTSDHKPASLEEKFPVPEPSLGWFVTTLGTSIFIFIGCFFLVGSNHSFSRPLWLALTDNYHARIPVLMGACLSLSALEWILIVPALHSERGVVQLTLVIAGFGFLVPLAAWFKVWQWSKERRDVTGKKEINRDLCHRAVFVLVYCLLLVMWAWCCGGPLAANDPASLMFRMRSVQLYSGVSPALPLVLLSAVFAGGFLGYYYRFTQAGIGRPRLLHEPDSRMKTYYDAVEQFIGAPMRLGGKDVWRRFGACAVAVLICILVLWKRLRPFERSLDSWPSVLPFQGKPYAWALDIAILALAMGLVAGCYDLLFTWRNLKRMLNLIEFYPLDDAFQRITHSWPRRPVWAVSRSISQSSLAAQMMGVLHRRRVAGDQLASASDECQKMRDAALECFANEMADQTKGQTEADGGKKSSKRLPARLEARQFYQSHIAELALSIFEKDLKPYWKNGVLETQVPFTQHSADFVALQYCNFVIYAARQIQRIAWGVAGALLMLAVVLNCYPFQAPLMVGRFVVVAFVLVGIIVVSVFAGMERNAILSRIARTKPGELNAGFWFQILAMGILPAIGVLSHLFPSIATFMYSWVAPSLESLR